MELFDDAESASEGAPAFKARLRRYYGDIKALLRHHILTTQSVPQKELLLLRLYLGSVKALLRLC